MLVFWKARLVILAVPKTGTTALAEAYGPAADIVVRDPPELKHAPVYRYNRFFRPMFDRMGGQDMTLAAQIREPVDWLGSWYRYRRRGFLEGQPTSTRGMDFEAFCEAVMARDRPAFAQVGSQAKFLEPRPNGVRVEALFRYEDMAAFQDYLEDKLGVRPDLPRRNAAPDAPLTLSDRTRAKLTRRFRDDYALWNTARQAR